MFKNSTSTHIDLLQRRYFCAASVLRRLGGVVALIWAVGASAQSDASISEAHSMPPSVRAGIVSGPGGSLIPGGLTGEALARHEFDEEFSNLFRQQKFEKLEHLYNKAVTEEQRFPSGVYKAYMYARRNGSALAPTVRMMSPDGSISRESRLAHWQQMKVLADNWAKAFPQSSGAVVIQSEILLRTGFVHRGGGYASGVPADDMKRFREFVDLAHDALSARSKMGQKDPAWHTQMLQVGRLQSWLPAERYSNTLKNALTAFPGFYDIYFEAALASTPQWGGSAQAVESLAQLAVENTMQTEGQALYARIYWSISSMFRGDPVVYAKAEWPRMRAGFDDVVARYPDPWNLNTFAKFACQAGDASTVRRLFDQIGKRVDLHVWLSVEVMDGCWALAQQSKGK